MSATGAASRYAGRERIRELVQLFHVNQGYLSNDECHELIGLARNPVNLLGMSESEVRNLRAILAVVSSQANLY
jgi:hypothetical protein